MIGEERRGKEKEGEGEMTMMTFDVMWCPDDSLSTNMIYTYASISETIVGVILFYPDLLYRR